MTSSVCAGCRRVVDYAEGVFEDERWFHERCYFNILKKQEDALKKKFFYKTITLEEAEELNELTPLLDKFRKSMREPRASLSQILGTPKAPVFEGRSDGMRLLREHQMQLEEHQHRALLTDSKIKRAVMIETPVVRMIE